jgi:hypothetical protein
MLPAGGGGDVLGETGKAIHERGNPARQTAGVACGASHGVAGIGGQIHDMHAARKTGRHMLPGIVSVGFAEYDEVYNVLACQEVEQRGTAQGAAAG